MLVLAVVFGASAAAHTPSRSYCGLRYPGSAAPAWLSDRTLAFIGPASREVIRQETLTQTAGENRVLVAEIGGSGTCRVAATTSPNSGFMEVRAAAGGRLVVADLDYRLFSLDRATGRRTNLGDVGIVGNEPVFTVSPNGREIAFTRQAPCPKGEEGGPCTRIGLVAVRGGPLHWLAGANGADDPSFSPDGREVVFTRASELVVEPASSGPAVPLGVHGYAPAWSPNGKWIAFPSSPHGGPGPLELIDPITHQTRSLTRSSVLGFAWSPTGRKLVYLAGGKIGTVDLSGKTRLVAVPHRLRPGYQWPQWSPDGRILAFTLILRHPPRIDQTSTWVYTVNADGSRLRRVP